MKQQKPYDLILLDEAQRIKNPFSQTAVSCRMIPRERSWVLTGTPLENKVDDLYAIFSFVRRGLLKPGTLADRQELHRDIAPYFLRRRKIDVLAELPERIDQTIQLELTPAQSKAYQLEIKRIAAERDLSTGSQILAHLTRLKLLCNFETKTGSSIKIDFLREILEEVEPPHHRLIIFSQYVRTLKYIRKKLTGIRCLLYHGGLPLDERERTLTRFRNAGTPTLLLLSLQAGGVGLNLNEADKLILFDRWWNPAVEEQAIGRAHRFGRKTPLHVIRLQTVDTIEEKIAHLLETKRELFHEYIDTATTPPPGNWPRDELRKILSLELLHQNHNN